MQALERLGLKVITVAVTPENGLDIAALERAFQNYPVKACWLMSSFQNPIGYSLSDEKKQRIARLLETYDVTLIEDDVYAELYATSAPPLPIKHFTTNGNSMLCSSFSKSLVAGYRIGWVAAGHHCMHIQKQQLMTTLATSAPIQMALVDYLKNRNYESHLNQLRKKLIKRKKAMAAFLKENLQNVATIHIDDGGYFLWIECQPQVDTMDIYREALRMHITIAPGKLFTLNNEFAHCFRINASFELTDARRALLSKLTRYIQKISV